MLKSVNPVQIEFLRTELETAFTFVKIAEDTSDPEKKLRNVENSHKAYDTLLHFSKQLPLPADERDALQKGISELRLKLTTLGEKF